METIGSFKKNHRPARFFISYLAVLRLHMEHWRRISFSQLMLISGYYFTGSEGHRKTRNEFGSQRPAEHVTVTLSHSTTPSRVHSISKEFSTKCIMKLLHVKGL